MAGRYKAYPEYKKSGINWIGSIPTLWKVVSLRHLISSVKNGSTATQTEQSATSVPVSRIETISTGHINMDKTGFVDPNSISESFKLDAGDLLLSHINSLSMVGNVAQVQPNDFLFHGMNLLRIIPKESISSKYLFWQLKSDYSRKLIESVAKPAINQASVSTESLKALQMLLPSIEEQQKIANFLDHETAKIDTLIAKQEKLIELLKEKRQAVISHAVTKGLNPQAPMKDSGVEWLGEVPEHWSVKGFNHCAKIRGGLVDPKLEQYKDLVLYAPNHIEKETGKVICKESADAQGADSNKYLCFKGEVIYSKIRPALAKVALCDEEVALCSADMYPIDAYNGLTNTFLYWFLLSDSFTKAVVLDSDRVAMPKVNRESLGEYRVPVPPMDEQLDICSSIKRQSRILDELEDKASYQIALMKERKTALISAAVTGKIDVRHFVVEQGQPQGVQG
ncbi:hypothetical protein BOO92_18580 [Vibrio navarrensis]|uniref:restriction endonuclease subunit S n=1 Tax=Vibrio navarrensis TaxID=29495 RepID=UPI0018670DB2|nr:restriction endonuclease subunit S [Vibrio navarrensis]MBE3658679.1 hypothetical protein [Vibrio navarrensis]